MMLYPAMNELLAQVPSRYKLVNVVAARARQIAIEADGNEPLLNAAIDFRVKDEPEEPVYLDGDINCDGVINSIDAAAALRADTGITVPDLGQRIRGDVSGDGTVNSLDAAQILKYDAMIITSFANANFSLEAYIQLCIDYYGHYVDVVE